MIKEITPFTQVYYIKSYIKELLEKNLKRKIFIKPWQGYGPNFSLAEMLSLYTSTKKYRRSSMVHRHTAPSI